MSGERQQTKHGGPDTSPPAAGNARRLYGDDIAGIVILVFVGVVIAITTTFEAVPVALSQGIPPEQFPRILVAVIALLAIIMIVQSRFRQDTPRKSIPAMVLATAILLLVFVIAIDLIGMIASMFVFCLALPVLWGEKRFLWVGVYAVIFPACIYLLFSVLLGVRLPLGLFSG